MLVDVCLVMAAVPVVAAITRAIVHIHITIVVKLRPAHGHHEYTCWGYNYIIIPWCASTSFREVSDGLFS